MSSDTGGEISLSYGLEDKPPLPTAIALAIQHVAVMIVPTTAVAFIVAGDVGLGAGETGYLVQMVLLFSGLATIVQAYTVGPVGAKLPIVMGTSFAFVGAAGAIGAEYGLAAVFGALALSGFLVEGVIGWQFKRIKPYFPPLVTGLIVVIIGLYLIPVGMEYSAGGVGSPDFGSLQNLGLAASVMGIAVLCNLFLRGTARVLSIILGISVGYVLAVAMGMVDFSPVVEANWIEIPTPGEFGYEFEPVAILTFGFLFLVSAMETVGDMTGITAAEGRNPTNRELRGGIFADGFMSSIGALFSAFPTTSFSQNVGIVNFTGVMSRHVVGIGGVLLVGLGLIPKVGATVAATPDAVFGGAVLVMVGMVAASGMRLLFLNIEMDRRNMVIIATALGLGLGVEVVPEALQGLPGAAEMFFGEPVIMVGLTALLLNTFVPGEQSPLFDDPDTDVAIEEPINGSVTEDD
ncbi:uracil-xanthine permease family protein [Natronococcus occultus]|uniref:Xanthine permease n=1 Tax=Natronococcus occultus SP4 TaxID=694430 RepID=L0K449_9EURY|nr:nucleobase:cation symporter-2 family protein [Natronococcus occultus]AGB38878.1 xanthine permease [Natronococcus occultus SP4]